MGVPVLVNTKHNTVYFLGFIVAVYKSDYEWQIDLLNVLSFRVDILNVQIEEAPRD